MSTLSGVMLQGRNIITTVPPTNLIVAIPNYLLDFYKI